MLFELVDILSTLLNVWDQINTMMCATMVWGENKKIYIYIQALLTETASNHF